MIRFNSIRCLLAGFCFLSLPRALHSQTIDYFTPEYGQVGQQITIHGSGFAAVNSLVTGVRFNGVNAPYQATSASTLFTWVPPGATSGPISVRTITDWQFSTEDFTVIGPYPYVDSFSPTSGPAGTEITIDGVQFQNNVTAVKMNGTNVPNTNVYIQSDTRIKVIAPANVTTGPITLVGFGTGSSTTTELFYVPPVITGFSPPSGRAGEDLTIRGINLTNATQVRIGNVPMPVYNVNSNTQIVATVPSGAVSGKVTVWTPGGQFQTTTNFTLLPSISGFTPQTGTTNTQVTISGANLNVPPLSVKFNGVAATVVSSNFNQIIATAPASTSGALTVTTGDGSVTSASLFYYPPGITSFSPGFGGEGTQVNISGRSFTNATAVKFDGASALTFTVNNNGAIQATAPNNVSTGPLSVTAPGGEAVSTALFYAPATFTGFLPSSGFSGTDVILFGANFEGATAVAFNGTPAAIVSNTGDQIATKVPTNATSGLISITTPAGTVASASAFAVPGTCNLRVNTFLNTPNPVAQGGDLTLTIVPSNDGPNTASNVTASVTLGPGAALKSASTQKGTVNTNGNPVVFNIGSLTTAENPTLILVVVPQTAGSLTNTVTLASSTFDSNPGNNTDSRVTTVLPPAELNIGQMGSTQVRVSWPVSLSNYVLQSTPVLTNNPPWVNVPGTPAIEGNKRVVTQPSTGATKYYRLKQ